MGKFGNTILQTDLDGQGNYLTNVQNIPDLASKGAGYWFDGVDDVVTIPTIILDTTAFTFIAQVSRVGIGSDQVLMGYSATHRKYIRLTSTGKLHIETNTDSDEVFGTLAQNTTACSVYAITANNKVITMYQNGTELSTDVSSVTDDALEVNRIGNNGGDTDPFNGNIYFTKLFNLALTAAEVKAFSSGAPIPFSMSGASQTILNSGSLTLGKKYRITAQDGVDFTADGAASNDVGTEFVATATTVTLDANDTVVRIGAVLMLEQDGITDAYWYDKSGNNLHGTVSGALPINRPLALYPPNGQIAFPATAVPSADPNTLDDYEEGTWTPVLGGDSGADSQTYSTQVGQYTKLGNMVAASFNMILTDEGTQSGTYACIRNIPFNNGTNYQGCCVIAKCLNLSSNISSISGHVAINLIYLMGAAADGTSPGSNLDVAIITNTTALSGSIVYYI